MIEDEFSGESAPSFRRARLDHDQAPEMSAALIADRVVQEIAKGAYDFIVPQLRQSGHGGPYRR